MFDVFVDKCLMLINTYDESLFVHEVEFVSACDRDFSA